MIFGGVIPTDRAFNGGPRNLPIMTVCKGDPSLRLKGGGFARDDTDDTGKLKTEAVFCSSLRFG